MKRAWLLMVLFASPPVFAQTGTSSVGTASSPDERPAPVVESPVVPDAGFEPPPPPPPPPPPKIVARPRRKVKKNPPDAGVPDAGPSPAAFIGPPPPPPAPPVVVPVKPESGEGRKVLARIIEMQWTLLQVLIGAFILFRFAAWLVRRGARAQNQLATTLSRLWIFVEGAGWTVIAVWLFTLLSKTESTVSAGLAAVVVLALVALSWSAIKDVIAGVMISAERPFSIGDHVRIGEAEGQVRNFRTRVLELETDDGHVMRVPYRQVGGATDVRAGGRRTAHAVTLTLQIPENLDASEALEAARELAASSPWSVLGVAPKLSLVHEDSQPSIRMEAYAFDREAGPLLHADLLRGWK